jgi:hypothetical protein
MFTKFSLPTFLGRIYSYLELFGRQHPFTATHAGSSTSPEPGFVLLISGGNVMSTTFRRILYVAAMSALPWTTAEVDAQVNATIQWVQPVEAVFVADLTPLGADRNPDFIAITLTQPAGRSQNIVLELNARMESPDRLQIVRGTTDPFLFTGTVRRITNRDMASRSSDVEITDYEVDPQSERLARSATLPTGTYVFGVVVRTPTGLVLGSDEVRLSIGSPTRLQLLSPGVVVGDAPPVITTPSPRFSWTPDQEVAGAAAAYRLTVARADGAASGEEAIQGFASWQTVTGSTTAFYPGSAEALPLEPGATYAWQVTREVRTTAGVETVESPIYWFRMAESGAGGGERASADEAVAQRVEQLATMLGIAELTGKWTVASVTVDGRPAPLDGVSELLAAIAAGQVQVLSIRVR